MNETTVFTYYLHGSETIQTEIIETDGSNDVWDYGKEHFHLLFRK